MPSAIVSSAESPQPLATAASGLAARREIRSHLLLPPVRDSGEALSQRGVQ
jgi:hypothetical protein